MLSNQNSEQRYQQVQPVRRRIATDRFEEPKFWRTPRNEIRYEKSMEKSYLGFENFGYKYKGGGNTTNSTSTIKHTKKTKNKKSIRSRNKTHCNH